MVSIIIPVYNQEEYTKACIESIKANTEDYQLIIIDNGSKPEFRLEDLPIGRPYSVRWNEENLGFPKAVNQGIERAKGDIIVILNNDVVVTPHWLETLQKHLSNGFDMVGACTNSSSGPQQVLIDQYNDIATLYEAAESNRKKHEGQSFPYHRIVFICVAIKREVIDKIGLLDEIYTPGNFEDDDYCMRAIEAGFKLGISEDCYVHHFGSITHKAMDINYRELLAKNQKIFNEKWGSRYKELMRINNG